MGPGTFSHMMQVRGLNVADLVGQQNEEKAQGIPSHWTTYFAVDKADDVANKAKRANGKVRLEPFDVCDSGRMAILQDPQGAVFGIWQANKHHGYMVVEEPGTVTWTELLTTDAAKAGAFYSAVGVPTKTPPGPMPYTHLKAGNKDVGGIMELTEEMGPMPPQWTVYFASTDPDTTTRRAESLGGKTPVTPRDIPGVGRFAVLQDPQGAAFCVFRSSRA